jgi:hypothetical protein
MPWLQIELIVPDPKVLGQQVESRDRRFGPAQLPLGDLVQRDAEGGGEVGTRLTPVFAGVEWCASSGSSRRWTRFVV